MKQFLKYFLISTIIFSVSFYGLDNFILNKESPAIAKFSDKEALDESNILKDEKNQITSNNKDELQFVLMGIDESGLKAKKGVRTDTLIAFNINFENGQIDALTIPRDSRVDVNGRKDKINHAHSIGGPDLSMTTINNFLGTNIENYVRIDFKGLMTIVDAIGGVRMNVPVDMNYSDPTAEPPLHIKVKKGDQLLSGKMSHDVLRFRHNNGSDAYPGGYSREEVQQMWLKEFIKTALSPKNFLKLPEMVKSYFDFVDTNIPFLDIISYTMKANNLDPSSIYMVTIPEESPGHIINGAWYYLPDLEESRRLANTMFNGNDNLYGLE